MVALLAAALLAAPAPQASTATVSSLERSVLVDINALRAQHHLATLRLNVRLSSRAGNSGRLFGAVTVADIAAAVSKAGGPSLDKRKIEIPNPIKTVGSHRVSVRLHPDVAATIGLTIVAA